MDAIGIGKDTDSIVRENKGMAGVLPGNFADFGLMISGRSNRGTYDEE